MTFFYVLLALLLLGILIAVHEFGHFIMARLTGIAVKEFSIGMGPQIFQRVSKKHGTLFSLRGIPMGGFCMYYGDTDDDPKGEKTDDPRNFTRAPVWKRALCVVGGPTMNLALAFVVAVILMAGWGMAPTQPYIDSVEAGMPAQQAGLLAGDIFLRVGDAEISTGAVQDVVAAIDAAEGAPLPVTILRNGEQETLPLAPVWDTEMEQYRIGILISGYGPLPAAQIIPAAWESCIYAGGAIISSLGQLLTTGEGAADMAGPVGIVQLVAEQTRQGGIEIFLNLMVLISINLGLFNLLPIPALDGSHLVFLLLEAIRRKPVSQKVQTAIHAAGYLLLLGVLLVFTFQDVGRIFGA